MKSSKKKVFYNDLVFYVLQDVYEPAEDTFLLAENLAVREDDLVLDMGTGCGILAVLAAKKAKKVVAVDLNPHAVRCTKLNAEMHGVVDKVDVRLGDLFQPIGRNEKFDVIVFNAPYLPSTSNETRIWIGRAWAGGPTGRRIIDRFIKEASRYLKRNGRILLVQSSLANIDRTLERFRQAGLEAKVIAEEKVAFETIVVIQASHLFEKRINNCHG